MSRPLLLQSDCQEILHASLVGRISLLEKEFAIYSRRSDKIRLEKIFKACLRAIEALDRNVDLIYGMVTYNNGIIVAQYVSRDELEKIFSGIDLDVRLLVFVGVWGFDYWERVIA